ncbi:DUF317 domain-containing protein [Streptomyces sp. NPDC001739]
MHDEMGNYYVTTMDSRLRVAFIPEESEILPDSTALWQVRARTALYRQPVWTAAFTDETPPEIVAGLTAALDADVTNNTRERDRYLTRNDHPDAVWEVMRTAGWHMAVDGLRVTATSPDGLASLTYRPPSTYGRHPVPRSEAWRATVYPSADARRSLWEADFHSAAPAHLVVSFATALTNPAPLTRESATIPSQCRAYARPLHEPSANRAPVAPTPLDIRRVHAARARSVRTSDSTLRWSTTSQMRPAPASAPAGPRRQR